MNTKEAWEEYRKVGLQIEELQDRMNSLFHSHLRSRIEKIASWNGWAYDCLGGIMITKYQLPTIELTLEGRGGERDYTSSVPLEERLLTCSDEEFDAWCEEKRQMNIDAAARDAARRLEHAERELKLAQNRVELARKAVVS